MAKEEIKIMTFKLPESLKNNLESMADETGINQSALVKLATQSMIANYKKKGSFIFADLLNPEHKDS